MAGNLKRLPSTSLYLPCEVGILITPLAELPESRIGLGKPTCEVMETHPGERKSVPTTPAHVLFGVGRLRAHVGWLGNSDNSGVTLVLKHR